MHAGDIFNLNTKTTETLVKISKLSAKIDNSCIQDGYTLYQHNFFITEKGDWAVVQQGLNTENKYARRYHWLGSQVDKLLNDPNKDNFFPEEWICSKVKAINPKYFGERDGVSVVKGTNIFF